MSDSSGFMLYGKIFRYKSLVLLITLSSCDNFTFFSNWKNVYCYWSIFFSLQEKLFFLHFIRLLLRHIDISGINSIWGNRESQQMACISKLAGSFPSSFSFLLRLSTSTVMMGWSDSWACQIKWSNINIPLRLLSKFNILLLTS